MKNNLILFDLALLIICIFLFVLIIFKDKKLRDRLIYLEEKNRDRAYLDKTSKLDLDNSFIIDKITELELEILKLRTENKRMAHRYEDGQRLDGEKEDGANKNFKNILNYNFFEDRNRDIIKLYKAGRPKEDIAKSLNKSIREVEMIINLVK